MPRRCKPQSADVQHAARPILFDIEKSILSHLVGEQGDPLRKLQEPVVILAHDLTPSETANLDPKFVYAFATEAGGKASHTAIMAGVLEIPAVVGLGRLLTDVSGGDEIIVDGNRGVVILNPDEETRERYLVLQRQFGTFAKRLDELRDLPAETTDGTRAALLGNIEFPQEAAHCTDRGADGVGLYRTEFLYLNKTGDPNENEQYEAYMAVLRAIGPHKQVVIRTLDLGADKLFHRPDMQLDEKNPVPGDAQCTFVPAQFALVQNAASCHSAGQPSWRRADHVPDGQHAPGVAPVQDDPRRRQGGARRGEDPLQSQDPGRHHDRSPVGRPDGGGNGKRSKFLFHWHE